MSTSSSTSLVGASRVHSAAQIFCWSSTQKSAATGIPDAMWVPPTATQLSTPNAKRTSKLTGTCQAHLDLRDLLQSNAFTIILYALPLKADHVDLITAYAREHHIPLIAVHSVGFYSYFSTRLPGTFPVVDTHPEEAASTDLRLVSPWPDLAAFARNMTRNIDSLDDHDHGHLPLVVILLHYLFVWRQSHGDANPTSYKDKAAFRGLIARAMRKNNAEGGEENFEEAIAAVMKLITVHPLPSSLRQVFDHRDLFEVSLCAVVVMGQKQQADCFSSGPVPF